MNNEEKRILEEVRLHALNHVRNILPSIKSLEEELNGLKKEYKDYKEQYEDADHALAEEDGRLMKVAIGKSGRVKKLTLEQIKSVAKQLGIKL